MAVGTAAEARQVLRRLHHLLSQRPRFESYVACRALPACQPSPATCVECISGVLMYVFMN